MNKLVCDSCKALNAPHALFCSACGNPLRQPEPEAVTEVVRRPGGKGWIVGAAVSAAVAVIAVAALMLWNRGPTDTERAHDQMSKDGAIIGKLTRSLGQASTVDQTRNVGEQAYRALPQLRSHQTEIMVLESADVRERALRVHRDVTTIIESWAQLRSLNQKDLESWPQQHVDSVLAAADDLRDGALDAAPVPQDTNRSFIDHRAVRSATLDVARYLTVSDDKLERWRKDLAAYKKRRSKAAKNAVRYRDDVRGLISSYNETRDNLQQYVDDVKSDDGSISQFRIELETARGEREGIRASLQTITAQAPRRVRSQHHALISLLDKAIRACSVGIDVADEIQELRDLGDHTTSGFELASYDEFQRLSNEISVERDAAFGAWERGIRTYIRRLGGNPPARPRV